MKNILLGLLTAAAAFFLAPASAHGHHGYAAFDTTGVVTFKVTVNDFHFVNPHCVVEFDVKDDSGVVRAWQAELSSASHLAPRGWTAASLESGDEITITGYKAKNGAPSLWVTKIVLPKGKEMKIDAAN